MTKSAAARTISFLRHPRVSSHDLQEDVQHAVHNVKTHDPVADLPGRLLPSQSMKLTYYAVRSFWVETGLRFGTTAKVPPNATPSQHLEWWQEGINHAYHDMDLAEDWNHPTLRLLRHLSPHLSKQHFDDILQARRVDLDLKQYKTLQNLVDHSISSCGSLSELVLEGGGVTHVQAYEVARRIGTAHGLTNALRTSIPVISTTGKLVVPQDLCAKYGVKSPRYLLSALGLGDEQCRKAFHNAIRDIVDVARYHLQTARELRHEVLRHEDGAKAVPVFLPALASETFLWRLERANYDLTNRNLRNVGLAEQAMCAGRMLAAYFQKRY